MDEAGIKVISDTLGRSIQEVLKVMSRAEQSALRKGANIIKKRTKQNLRSTGIDINRPNDKYNDKLIDAVRSSKVRDGAIVTHVMGTTKTGSGTFRLRFFEGGTQERYAKTYNGKPLKKKHRLGKIKAYNFFNTALNSSQSEVMDAMDAQLTKYIEKAWNNG